MMDGQLKSGTILTSESGSRYTVKQLLGSGGQGEVYAVEAEHKAYALNGTIRILLPETRRKSWIISSRAVRQMFLSCGRRI